MSAARLEVGDWVFATEEIAEQTFAGTTLIHAKPNAVGHVMGYAGDDFYTVTWERTLTTTDCHASELAFMCGADGGRAATARR